jgi:hypothetical protein
MYIGHGEYIKCPVDLTTAVEERNISQLDIKLQVCED